MTSTLGVSDMQYCADVDAAYRAFRPVIKAALTRYWCCPDMRVAMQRYNDEAAEAFAELTAALGVAREDLLARHEARESGDLPDSSMADIVTSTSTYPVPVAVIADVTGEPAAYTEPRPNDQDLYDGRDGEGDPDGWD